MSKTTSWCLFGCSGFLVALLLFLIAIPFTRVLALGLIRGEPVGEDLRPLSVHIKRLSDPDPDVVDHSLHEISIMDEKAAPAIPALLELARDPERGSRHTGKRKTRTAREDALEAIGRMGTAAAPAVPDLIPFLSHPHTPTRVSAILALHKIGPAAVADPRPLAAPLRDPDWGVQDLMRRLLGELATDFYKDKIRRLMSDESPRLRRQACEWAGHFGPPGQEFLPALQKALSDPEPDVRGAAAEAIRDIEVENVRDPKQP